MSHETLPFLFLPTVDCNLLSVARRCVLRVASELGEFVRAPDQADSIGSAFCFVGLLLPVETDSGWQLVNTKKQ